MGLWLCGSVNRIGLGYLAAFCLVYRNLSWFVLFACIYSAIMNIFPPSRLRSLCFDRSTTDETLRDAFSQYGQVLDVSC
jgi:RNA recognition motif-containing protein